MRNYFRPNLLIVLAIAALLISFLAVVFPEEKDKIFTIAAIFVTGIVAISRDLLAPPEPEQTVPVSALREMIEAIVDSERKAAEKLSFEAEKAQAAKTKTKDAKELNFEAVD